MNTELAEQPEVHVTDQSIAPEVEKMFAVRLEAFEAGTIHKRSVGREAALRRRDGDRLATQELAVIDGDSVDGVTLGHAGRDVTGTLGAS